MPRPTLAPSSGHETRRHHHFASLYFTGLVPNSIIRAQIGYIPPEVIVPPHRPKLKAKQPHSAVQKNSWPLAKPRGHLSGENLQRRGSSTQTERDGEVITCISEPDSPVEKTTTVQFSQSSNRQKSPSGIGSGGAASFHGKGIGMDDAATTQGPSLHVHGSSSARRHSIEAKPKVVTRFEPPLEEQVRSRKASSKYSTYNYCKKLNRNYLKV